MFSLKSTLAASAIALMAAETIFLGLFVLGWILIAG